MDCLLCKELSQLFETASLEYRDARSSAFYQVSTEFAAVKRVDMERAKSSLEEHQLICDSSTQVGGLAFVPPYMPDLGVRQMHA